MATGTSHNEPGLFVLLGVGPSLVSPSCSTLAADTDSVRYVSQSDESVQGLELG